MSLYDIYDAHKEEQEKARAEADRLKEQAQLATGKVADSVLDAINSGLLLLFLAHSTPQKKTLTFLLPHLFFYLFLSHRCDGGVREPEAA